jgi:hypothetical protein
MRVNHCSIQERPTTIQALQTLNPQIKIIAAASPETIAKLPKPLASLPF